MDWMEKVIYSRILDTGSHTEEYYKVLSRQLASAIYEEIKEKRPGNTTCECDMCSIINKTLADYDKALGLEEGK
jgi:hypothetical protein